jgi:hypothetical protein
VRIAILFFFSLSLPLPSPLKADLLVLYVVTFENTVPKYWVPSSSAD